MKKVLKDLFIKKEVLNRRDNWNEYAQEARNQFLALKEKGIAISVMQY